MREAGGVDAHPEREQHQRREHRHLARREVQDAAQVVARDGAEALDYLFGGGEPGVDTALPQVILLDLNLPKLSGHDVLRRIRAEARTRLVPVIMLTSSCEEADIVTSYELGANGYVQKPVDFGQFTEAVKTLGQFWLSLNQQPATS